MNFDTKKTLLLIDEEQDWLSEQKELLKKFGYKTLTARNGEEAIKIFNNNKNIDLILIDIDLNTGINSTETSRKLLTIRDIPIIVLLSYDDKKTVDKIEKITSYGYILKKSETTILDNSIKMVLKLFYAHKEINRLEKKANNKQSTATDSSECKEINRNLISQKQELDFCLKGANVGTWAWNIQTGEMNTNERWASILGYTLEEISPVSIDTWMEFIHPDDLKKSEILLDAHFNKDSEYFERENRMKHKKGEWVWILDRGQVATWTEDGKPLLMYGTHQDITTQKKAEKKSYEAYQIINRSHIVAFLWQNKNDWPIEFVSENVKTLTGYSAADFIGGKVSFTNMIYKDDIDRVKKEVASNSSKKGKHSIIHEPYRITTKNGHIKWIADKTFIRRNSNNNITHYEGIVTDITKEKNMEAKLLQASRMEIVGTLAGGVSHDFNTLLGVILGYGEMILDNISPESQNGTYLLEIMRAGNRSRELVQHLMDFSIPDKDDRKPEQLSTMIEKSLPLLKSSLSSKIDIKYKSIINSSPIYANSSQIQQVIMNLGMNAAQAMKKNGGNLNIILKEAFINDNLALSMNVKKGYFLKLVISDTGQGMDSNTIKHIFEPFYTSKPRGEGTGLGLSIVYGIIKSHDGFIKVFSRKGEGSTFNIYLPKI